MRPPPRRFLPVLVLGLCAALLLPRYFSPARQLAAKTRDLLDALEDADRSALAELLADSYTDQWGQDRGTATDQAMRAARQFWSLHIDTTRMDQELATDGSATVTLAVRLDGRGTPASTLIANRVHRLDAPFTLRWQRLPWRPWSWKLIAIANPDLPTLDP